MPSTNVIGVTLVLFLKQEVIKYHQIFMLRGDFFWVRLIHKNYSQWALWKESFDFLPTLQSTGLVKFVLIVFHHGFQKLSLSSLLAIVLQNLFFKFYTLVETNFFQKLTISNSLTSQV